MSPKFLYETGIRKVMYAAREYLEEHHLEADEGTLIKSVVAHIQATLPSAGKAALDAVEASSDVEVLRTAVKAFNQTMTQAGIKAARKALRPQEVAA